MKQKQEQVAEYIEKNNLDATTAFKIMDLVAEVGEVVQDAVKSADYGLEEEELEVKKDEIGDALFCLLAVAEDLGIDAGEALEESMSKYEKRIEDKGDPGSG